MGLNLSLIMCLVFSGACLVLNRPFLEATEKNEHKKAIIYKIASSLCFVALTGISVVTENVGFSKFWLVVALGLFFGTLGDLLLAFRHLVKKRYYFYFAIGAAAFIMEHLMFIGYFLIENQDIIPIATLCFVVSFATATFVLAKTHVDGGKLRVGVYVYVAIVCFMSATAISTAIKTPSVGSLMFAIGSLCFVASDTTICVYNFSEHKDFRLMTLLHYLYSPAQILFALSVMFI